MHYYKFNIADYRKDTGHLSLLEHGIYRQLLDTYYLDEKPIETQLVIRRLSIRTEDEKTALNNVLDDFFEPSECGKFHIHARVDREISGYQTKGEIAKANGSKGGRPKKPKKTQSVISANQNETKTKGNHKPLTNNHKPLKTSSPKISFSDDDMVTAEYFLKTILGQLPDFKKPNLEKWAETVRLMREQDNRTLADICRVWAWARGDPFWRPNILSADKFRKQFDALNAKASEENHAASQPNVSGIRPKNTLERIREQTQRLAGECAAEAVSGSAMGADESDIRTQVGEPRG